jgi:anti-sigma regulatory factor (Ser/Thr protein kinase)
MQTNLPVGVDEFSHEALLYSNTDEYLAGTVPFIQEGLASGEAVMVVELPDKIELLRSHLGAAAQGVHFADMLTLGANPALIIPAWRDFIDQNKLKGRRMRGIGEPIYPARRPAELLECQRHEELLNLAFDGGHPWRLLCPYDTSALSESVVNEGIRSHPHVHDGSGTHQKTNHGRPLSAPFDSPLPDPPRDHQSLVLDYQYQHLDRLRSLVAEQGRNAGLPDSRIAGLVMAANEVATNSLLHGGGVSFVCTWQAEGALVCEVTDGGHFDKPLIDRERPAGDPHASRGLWLSNHLCDLVQIHSNSRGTTVRLHMWLEPTPTN